MKTLARSKTITAHKLREVRDRLFAPKPIVTGTEYADDQCYLIEGGKLRKWTTYDFQREILDDFIDVTIGEVVVMKSARMGISECINHAVQYWLDHEPCDVLMYRPKDEDAEGYLTNRFDKRVEMVPAMKKIAFRTSTGKAVKKSTERKFKNGASLLVLGAAAEDNFRDHTKKKIILDEFDALNFGPVKGGGSKYAVARNTGIGRSSRSRRPRPPPRKADVSMACSWPATSATSTSSARIAGKSSRLAGATRKRPAESSGSRTITMTSGMSAIARPTTQTTSARRSANTISVR